MDLYHSGFHLSNVVLCYGVVWCVVRYAPLSARLVEFLQVPGWRAITGVLQVLPGPTLTETQQLPSALRQRSKHCFITWLHLT